METLRIVVDRGRCTGIGICESLQPERFEVDDDGTLIAHDPDVSEADLAATEEAVNACPAMALSLLRGAS